MKTSPTLPATQQYILPTRRLLFPFHSKVLYLYFSDIYLLDSMHLVANPVGYYLWEKGWLALSDKAGYLLCFVVLWNKLFIKFKSYNLFIVICWNIGYLISISWISIKIVAAMQVYGWIFVIYLLLLIGAAILMVRGINLTHRGLMLPWLILVMFLIFLQGLFSVWLIYGYYIYVSVWPLLWCLST